MADEILDININVDPEAEQVEKRLEEATTKATVSYTQVMTALGQVNAAMSQINGMFGGNLFDSRITQTVGQGLSSAMYAASIPMMMMMGPLGWIGIIAGGIAQFAGWWNTISSWMPKPEQPGDTKFDYEVLYYS